MSASSFALDSVKTLLSISFIAALALKAFNRESSKVYSGIKSFIPSDFFS